MQQCAKEKGIKDVPRCLLIGSYYEKKIKLTTLLYKGILITDLSLHVSTLSSNIYLMQPSAVS